MIDLTERVTRGAAWLDKVRPGWPGQVNLQVFDLGSIYDCVLGQVFREDARSAGHLGESGYLWAAGELGGVEGAIEHGFALPFEEREWRGFESLLLKEKGLAWAHLSALWEDLIRTRQAADGNTVGGWSLTDHDDEGA